MKASLVGFLVTATLMILSPVAFVAAQQASAIDARGVRHDASQYSGRSVPWKADIIKSVAPEYPYEERSRQREATGLFRITIDLKTGLVTDAVIIRSTGYRGLDISGIKSLRQWRWKPRTWRQIDIPPTFTTSQSSGPEQPSSPFIHVPLSGGHRGRP